jgi:hypothetical protein
MRVIKGVAILYFLFILAGPIIAAVKTYVTLRLFFPDPFDSPLWILLTTMGVFYGTLIICYRAFLRWFPFPTGDLEPNSLEETRWKVYMAIWLLFLYPIILPRWIPVPLTGWLYRCLGAKVGANSYFAGIVYDPHFVTIGTKVLGGAQSLIIPHIIENERLSHWPITIGNNVTIGAGSIILPGAQIEDDVMIGALAVIPKNAHLKRGDVWAGNPARFVRNRYQSLHHQSAVLNQK